MARVELPERAKPLDPEAEETAPEVNRTPKVNRTPGRWWPRLLLLLVLALLLLPTGLSFSGQLPVVLQKIHPQLGGAVRFRKVNLHWWAPVDIQGVTVLDLSQGNTDSEGQKKNRGSDSRDSAPLEPLAEVSRITTKEPLWKILFSQGRDVSIVLTEPKLKLVVDEHGSNLQKTIDSVFGPAAADSPAPNEYFPCDISIENGSLLLLSDGSVSVASAVDRANQPVTSAEPAVANAHREQVDALPVRTLISGITGRISTINRKRTFPELQLLAKVKNLLPAVVERMPNPTDGRATSPRVAANLSEITSDFVPLPLPDDSSPIENSISKPGQVINSGDAEIQLEIASAAEHAGRQTVFLKTRQLELRLLQPLLATVTTDIVCDGILSCNLEAELVGRAVTDGIVGKMELAGQHLQFRQSGWASGEWLRLGQTTATGAMAIARDGILLNQLTIRSDIADAAGSGELRYPALTSSAASAAEPATPVSASANSAQISGSVDLARIATMLPVTLGLHQDVVLKSGRMKFQFLGHAAGAATDTASATTAAGWKGTLQSDRLEATRGGQPVVMNAGLHLDASGPFRSGSPELEQAKLTADFGTVECKPLNGGYAVSGTVQPDLLWQQLQQLMDIPKPGLRGEVRFQSHVSFEDGLISLAGLKLTSSDLQAASEAMRILPANPVTSMLDGSLHVNGSGAAVRTLIAPWYSADWLAEGSAVSIDLSADPEQQIRLKAVIQPGQVAAVQRGSMRSVSRRTASPVAQSLIVDEGSFDLEMVTAATGDLFTIRRGTVQLPGIQSLVTGTVQAVGSDLELNLQADTQYDLTLLSDRILTSSSPLKLAGQGQDVFHVTGSPSLLTGFDSPAAPAARGAAAAGKPAAQERIQTASRTVNVSNSQGSKGSSRAVAGLTPLKASGTVSWDSGTLWGLAMGPAEVKAVLENGQLRTQPIQCSLNSGQINIMPQFDLVHQRLQLATGSRVENIDLTPELCREWLGYLAPLLGEAADVSGLISARVTRFDYDLNTPQNSDIQAVAVIHNAQASPGPSLTPLLEAIDLIRRTGGTDRSVVSRRIELPAQEVPIEVRQGFVMHQGLKIELAGYQAQSSGAVGLNRQLQLILDVPLEKSTGTGDTRSLKIPVQGSIDRPQLDTSSLLQNLGTQALEKRLNGTINNQLDQQLNKLFDKF